MTTPTTPEPLRQLPVNPNVNMFEAYLKARESPAQTGIFHVFDADGKAWMGTYNHLDDAEFHARWNCGSVWTDAAQKGIQ